MTIDIYWSCYENEWMLAKEPKPVLESLYDKVKFENSFSNIKYCPSIFNEMNNLYELSSIYSYSFKIEEEKIVSSTKFDQIFFNSHVLIRSLNDRFFSFKNSYIFFTEEKSLEASFYIFPFLENNNITKRCIPIPGKFNIGKWFRHTEFPFFLKKEYNDFIIDQDEVYCYIKFHTNQKIKFKQFVMNDRLKQIDIERTLAVEKTKRMYTLENYYSMQKNKKHIIKEIKESLI